MSGGAEYLVRHGRAGHLGRFRADGGARFGHGDCVVIRGRRGVELGEVLGESRPGTRLPDEYVGELVRSATDGDLGEAARTAAKVASLCAEAEALAAAMRLPVAVIDLELSLDGRSAVLHALRFAACDPGPLLEALGERHGLIVRWYDLGAEPPLPEPAADAEEAMTCGKEDCGQGDCGSHGGCSSCSAGQTGELDEYFAELRAKMERRVPLV